MENRLKRQMETSNLVGPIVKELLNDENYMTWCVLIKNYLLGQDLWDIIENLAEPSNPDKADSEYRVWSRKNAAALHAIQISCGPKALLLIIDIPSAKLAWDALTNNYKHLSRYKSSDYSKIDRGTSYNSVNEDLLPSKSSDNLEIAPEAGGTPDNLVNEDLLPSKSSDNLEIAPDAGGTPDNLVNEDLLPSKSSDNLEIAPDAGGTPDNLVNEDLLPSKSPDNLEIAPDARGTADNLVNVDRDQQYASLYKAVHRGDWKAAKEILKVHPEGVRAQISLSRQMALHTAALFGHLHIVEELVKLMSEEDMESKDIDGYTALATAARIGMTQIAECIIKKNKNLVIIPTHFKSIPVTMAVADGHLEMARYLYSVTPLEELLPEKGYHGATLLNQCFANNTLDFALDLLHRCPSLAITPDNEGCTFVFTLAGKPSIFPSGCQLRFWQRWIYSWIQIEPASTTKNILINIEKSNARENDDKMSKMPGLLHRIVTHMLDLIGIKRIYELKLAHMLSLELLRLTCNEIATLNNVTQMSKAGVYASILRAADRGIPEFIIEATKVNFDLSWSRDDLYRNFFFNAIEFRQAKVFSLIYGHPHKDSIASTIDKCYNSLLHMAGTLAPSTQLNRIAGAALQMQRELQWYKEVERIMKPAKMEYRNKDGMTARELFTMNHKDLVKEGEKWMKETASSCTVVGALIITMMFAASFTVPGGNNQNTGYPMFLDHELFKLFIISDAVSLFSSTTSVLMFLGILTSRYAEDDFLKSLPTKLIIGLSMLFISIAAMMITFCAALSIMLPGRLWIVVPVILFASVPVSLFVWLQFPLLVEIYFSTYGPGIFERNIKRWP